MRRPTHQTRASRSLKEGLKKALIWAFIVVFAFSVAGAMVVFTAFK